MPKRKRKIPEEKIVYKSRMSSFLALFNERLPKDKQIAMQHVATAIGVKRQTMYEWGDPERGFHRPDMQVAAGLAMFFNYKAAELKMTDWRRLQPHDMLITLREDEYGNLIEGIQLAPALQ
jgi:DNA-binding XRE family transcriptional regulator